MLRAVSLLVLALVVMTGFCFAEEYQPLRIEPSRFIYEAKPGEQINGSITVSNKGSGATSINAFISDWTLDLSGDLLVKNPGELESSLSNWIKFNPRTLKIQKNNSQIVRFTIKIPRDAKPGEHRGLIQFIQEIPYMGDGSGLSVDIQMATNIYVAVLPVTRSCTLVDASIFNNDNAEIGMSVDLKGTGNAHFRGTGKFEFTKEGESQPYAYGEFPQLVLLPDVTVRYEANSKSKLSPGRYQVAIIISPEEPGKPQLKWINEYTAK